MITDGARGPNRILLLALRSIGDIVLITPVIRLLKETFPKGEISILVEKHTAPVLQNHPCLERVLVLERSSFKESSWASRVGTWWHLVKTLRRHQFDVAIDLFSGPRSALLGFFSGARNRYGEDVRRRVRGWLYNHPIKVKKDQKHLIEQKMDLIYPLTGRKDARSFGLEVFLGIVEKKKARSLFKERTRAGKLKVGLVPGAGSPWRQWPVERFAKLGDELVRIYEAEILLLGGKDDQNICQRVCEHMEFSPLDLSGHTTLQGLMATMAELDVLISNLTGPMHLASALEKPKVIGLYGAADTVQYAPWGRNVLMLSKGHHSEAYWKNVDYQRDHTILLQIDVGDVLKAFKTIISR